MNELAYPCHHCWNDDLLCNSKKESEDTYRCGSCGTVSRVYRDLNGIPYAEPTWVLDETRTKVALKYAREWILCQLAAHDDNSEHPDAQELRDNAALLDIELEKP